MWAEVAGRLGLAYEWVEYETVGEILDAVQSGAADVAIAGISMTRDREAVVDFTHPYFDAGLQIMVPAGSSFSFRQVLSHFLSPEMCIRDRPMGVDGRQEAGGAGSRRGANAGKAGHV